MKHASPQSLVITLPADQMERLDELVESGEYSSRDDVVVEALKLWRSGMPMRLIASLPGTAENMRRVSPAALQRI